MFYGVKYLFKQSELCCVCYELHMFCGGGQKSLSTVSILNTGNLFWSLDNNIRDVLDIRSGQAFSALPQRTTVVHDKHRGHS